MSRLVKIMAVLAAFLLMAGCGASMHSAMQEYPAGYTYRYADFDYRYAWKSVTNDQGLFIEGIMKNVRYPYINSIDIKAELINKDGATLASGIDFPAPQMTREGDVSRFSMLLRGAAPSTGDILRFTVHYKGNEGERQGLDWISIFKADALTGKVIEPKVNTFDTW